MAHTAPTIWPTSLDLQRLDQNKNGWRNEVLRRTGDRLLTIIGYLHEGRPGTENFKDLLANHWIRIRRLFVCDVDSGLKAETLWDVLPLASPNLEFFLLDDTDFTDMNVITDTSLFSSDAPRLRDLQFQGLFINPTMSWLTNIQHLWKLDTEFFTVSKLCRALQNMPRLELLSIVAVETMDEDTEGDWMPVVLPSLKSLDISGELIHIMPILQFIIPGPDCTLAFAACMEDPTNFDASEVANLGKAFSRYFRSPQVNLEQMRCILSETDFILVIGRPYSVVIELFKDDTSSWSGIPCQIFKLPSSPSTVIELELELNHLPSLTGALLDFIGALVSLKALTANSKMLEILNNSQDSADPEGPIVFPRLDTLYFSIVGFELEDPLRSFIARRLDLNVRVMHLEIWEWAGYKGTYDFLKPMVADLNLSLKVLGVIGLEEGPLSPSLIDSEPES